MSKLSAMAAKAWEKEEEEIENEQVKTVRTATQKHCCKCNKKVLFKNAAEEFYPDPNSSDGLRGKCIECISIENHAAYLDRAEYVDMRLAEMLEEQNGVCAGCKKPNQYFEDAHFDREEKFRTASGKTKSLKAMSYKQIEEELPKTRLLCDECHTDETRAELQAIQDAHPERTGEALQRYLARCKYVAERRAIVNSDKISRGKCNCCQEPVNEKYLPLYQYYHLDPSAKVKRVSQMVCDCVPIQTLLLAMRSCQLVCRSCNQKLVRERLAEHGKPKLKYLNPDDLLQSYIRALAQYSDFIAQHPPPRTQKPKEKGTKPTAAQHRFNKTKQANFKRTIKNEKKWWDAGCSLDLPHSIRRYTQPMVVIRDAYILEREEWISGGRVGEQPSVLEKFARDPTLKWPRKPSGKKPGKVPKAKPLVVSKVPKATAEEMTKAAKVMGMDTSLSKRTAKPKSESKVAAVPAISSVATHAPAAAEVVNRKRKTGKIPKKKGKKMKTAAVAASSSTSSSTQA